MTRDEKRAYDRAWYAKQSESKKKQIVQVKTERRRRIRRQLNEFKKTLKCSRCPENDFACLDFHHTDDNKEISVGDAQMFGWSFERLMKEIEKCVVLCANCHRKHHYKHRRFDNDER